MSPCTKLSLWLFVVLWALSGCSEEGSGVVDGGAINDSVSVDRKTMVEQYLADQKAAVEQAVVDQKMVPDIPVATDKNLMDHNVATDLKVIAEQKVIADQKLVADLKAADQSTTPDQKLALDLAAPDQLKPADQGKGLIPGTWKTIPAGSFKMGSPKTDSCRYSNEPVLLPVTLTRAYEMQTTEVTQAQFLTVMGYSPSSFSTCSACPVENVSWHEAVAYCNELSARAKRTACYSCTGSGTKNVSCKEHSASGGKWVYDCKGYRLPTEAEWEYAYRAGSTTAFYNGPIGSCTGKDANADKIGWYLENSNKKTHPTALRLANAWGLYDMAGNVEEWCHDGYHQNLGTKAQTDPVGAMNSERVLRSGSFFGAAYLLRGAVRYGQPPQKRANNIGFRCVRSM